MNTNLKSDRSGAASRASVTSFHGNVSRQAGNIRAVTLEGSVIADSAVQESIETTFGKTTKDARLEADRKAYELKDNVLNAFGRMKNTWE